jgi:hypothetical protein
MGDANEHAAAGSDVLADHLDLEALIEAGDLRGVDGWLTARDVLTVADELAQLEPSDRAATARYQGSKEQL